MIERYVIKPILSSSIVVSLSSIVDTDICSIQNLYRI